MFEDEKAWAFKAEDCHWKALDSGFWMRFWVKSKNLELLNLT